MVQLRLRVQPWLNDQLLKKVTAITAVNALISVFIAGILVYVWAIFTQQRTSTGIVLQFLADMVLATIILTLTEELMLISRETNAVRPWPSMPLLLNLRLLLGQFSNR